MRIALAVCAIAAVGLVGCGGAASSDADVTADGSGTLGPFMQRAAQDFQASGSDLEIDVSLSGSSRGMERFCAGDIDIANMSRPIDEDEAAACREEGIDYVGLHIASDALTVAVYRPILYDWVTCLTVEQLKRIWEPGSRVSNWSEVDPSYPDVPLELYVNPDSGTFRYFNEVINGDAEASRTDFSATENHDETVEGVARDRGSLGYFGYSYYRENEDRLSALAIDGGNGCVAPSPDTVHDGSYEPLARRLFIYVSQQALNESRPVRSFVRYVLENVETIADEALFAPLSEAQAERQMREFITAIS